MYVWVTLEHSFAGIQSASDIFVDIVGSSIIIPQKTLERTDRWKDEEKRNQQWLCQTLQSHGPAAHCSIQKLDNGYDVIFTSYKCSITRIYSHGISAKKSNKA